MSQLKVNAISDAAGANGNAITLATDGTCTTKATNKVAHNFLYNGEMMINQRGDQTTVNGYGGPDRWKTQVSQGAFTASKDSESPPGFNSSLKLDCTTAAALTANNSIKVVQHLEGQDLQGFAAGTASAKSLTLSFWVRSNKTGVFNAHIYQKDGGKLVSQNTTISSANTWEKKTFTVAGNTGNTIDNDNSKSLTIEFWLDSGPDNKGGTITDSWAASASNKYGQGITLNIGDHLDNVFYLTGVQLELGDFASDFSYRSYGDELQRCLRYFWMIKGDNYDKPGISTFANNASTCRAQVKFPVPMRAAPTFTGSSTGMMHDSSNDSATFDISDFVLSSGNITTEANPSGCTIEVSTSSMDAGAAGDLEFKENGGSMQFIAEL